MSHIWDPDLSLLLSALPRTDRQRLQAHLMPVELDKDQTIYETNTVLGDVLFPISATISLRYALQNGAQTEIAEIGNEGMAGISVLLRGNTTPSRAVVQHAGYAYRLCATDLHKLLEDSPAAATLFSRYTLALMMHIAQTGTCNQHHDSEQRFCRWLLTAADKRRSPEVIVTQEQIANILGVRRETITASALNLQRSGSICYTRGCITLLDRTSLEKTCCECYFIVSNSYKELLSVS